jgi:UDPglucose--hexose-1-phosphate uridylyltransferase
LPGLQELIIPTPRHVCSLSELEVDEFSVALLAAQQRISAWRQSQSVEHAMLFKNCRHEAGASIEHTHFQLLGSPLASGALEQRAVRFAKSLAQTGATPLESLVAFEERQDVRVIARGRHFVMLSPFASRMAFQVWIIPRQRPPAFWECSPDMLDELAELGQGVVAKLEQLLSLPGYNWMLHQLPFSSAASDHWFVEIFPRLSKIAGYELGTEIWVNAVSPEAAVKRLR